MQILNDVADMNGYLKVYGSVLAEAIKGSAEPLFNPGDRWDDKLYSLLRKPYQAQGDAVMGLCKLLRDYDSAVVVGEMGCGKTLIGASVPYVYENGDRPARTLVMCPGHLVKKWQREVVETVPDAQARIVRNLDDLLRIGRIGEPENPEYVVVSKDRAKLGYAWRPAAAKDRNGGYHCTDCNELVVDRDGVPVGYEHLRTNKRFCSHCGGALWQADNSKIRRYPLSEYVKKYLDGYFDFFIADEVHELKGGTTAQGNSFGALSGACKKTIALTGTLLGGYADDIFYVLYRLSPKSIKEEGIGYGHVTGWMSKYGVLERVTRTYPQDNVCSKGKKGRTVLKRKPGVSPLVFSRHLLDKCVFLGLEDMVSDLPPISEYVHAIEMDEELADAYTDLEEKLSAEVRQALAKGSKALLGTYVNTLLSYPDRPFDNEPIVCLDQKRIIVPAKLPKDKVYNKERKLVELVKESVSGGRKAFTYAVYTGTKDVTARLQELLSDEGIDAEILRASVEPEKREEWLRQKVKSGTDAVIANPKLVQTGLDLYDFPDLIFYQTGYSIFTLRQASRRSWRIGQDKDVKVHYLYYRPTMQERAMQLMGSKLEASLAIEGKFSEEGLLAMTQGEDMTTAMAKALVEGLETEGVESVWSKLNKANKTEYQEALPNGMLVYTDPERLMKKKRAGRERQPASCGGKQLLLFGEV